MRARPASPLQLVVALLLLVLRAQGSEESNLIDSYLRAYMTGASSAHKNAKFGWAVTALGDLDGDGTPDLAASTPNYDDHDSGEVVIMFLNRNLGWSGYSMIEAQDIGLGTDTQLGVSLGLAGDLNGDGVNDLVAGSSKDEGEINILTLETNGDLKALSRIHGRNVSAAMPSTAEFGHAVQTIGDLDGNGVNDLVVGAPGFRNGSIIFLTLEVSETDGDMLQLKEVVSVISAADVNASLVDGAEFGASISVVNQTLLAVGAPWDGSGSVWLVNLTAGLEFESAVRVQTDELGLDDQDTFGNSVAVLGRHLVLGHDYDLDGDPSTIDLAVGAPRDDDQANNAGAVYLLAVDAPTGAVSTWHKLDDFDEVPDYTGIARSNLLGAADKFGHSLSILGDVNEDGEVELLAGAPGYSKSIGNNRGGGYVSMSLTGMMAPSAQPTGIPTVSQAPTTLSPTPMPTTPVPTPLTFPPTTSPTLHPTAVPTTEPTAEPTKEPSTWAGSPTSHPADDEEPVHINLVATLFWCSAFSFLGSCTFILLRKFCRTQGPSPHDQRRIRGEPPNAQLIRSIPKCKFRDCHAHHEGADNTCSICLWDMEPNTVVKELRCKHVYHPDCLDGWLAVSTVCPLCKRPAEPPLLGGAAEPPQRGGLEADDGRRDREFTALELVPMAGAGEMELGGMDSPEVPLGRSSRVNRYRPEEPEYGPLAAEAPDSVAMPLEATAELAPPSNRDLRVQALIAAGIMDGCTPPVASDSSESPSSQFRGDTAVVTVAVQAATADDAGAVHDVQRLGQAIVGPPPSSPRAEQL